MGRLRLRGRGGLLVVVALLLVVNLPLVHGAWIDRSIDRDGVEVTATVEDTAPSGDGGLVQFRFDRDVDPDQRVWNASLDGDAFDRAEDQKTVRVRVVPGSPERYRVDGESSAALLVVLTVFADLVLLLALVLLVRRRPSGPLRLVALEDVQRARPGGRLEPLTGTTYLVVGEVAGIEPDAVVLDVGGRQVHVALGAFVNPVGWEQPAQVRARVPESEA